MTRLSTTLLGASALTALLLTTGFASAQTVPEVPRNRTLISQGWDFYNQVPSIDNFNPYAGVLLHQRNSLHYTVNEVLFYTNHNTNETVGWQADSYTYNADFTEVTLKLRDGVKWSDGEAFTAEDVAFTFDMLKAAAPDLLFSSQIAEWVASATVLDPLTVVIKLNKPGPRWVKDFLATGQSTRFVTVPKHIWDGQDPKTFANFDLAKGWPVGTGPYKLVKSDASSLFYDLRDSWWAVDAGVAPAMPQVQRVVYVPATAEAMPQLFATNQIDMGRSIQAGQFEAIKAQNPGLVAWNEQGPVWVVQMAAPTPSASTPRPHRSTIRRSATPSMRRWIATRSSALPMKARCCAPPCRSRPIRAWSTMSTSSRTSLASPTSMRTAPNWSKST